MEEHIRALLQHFRYSEQFKETAAFRIVFGGETLCQVLTAFDSYFSYTLRIWVWESTPSVVTTLAAVGVLVGLSGQKAAIYGQVWLHSTCQPSFRVSTI